MKLNYTFGIDEYRAINTAKFRRRKFGKAKTIVYWAICAFYLIFGVGAAIFIYSKNQDISRAALLLVLLGLLMVLWRFVLWPLYLNWHFRRQIPVDFKVVLEAFDEKLTLETENASVTYKWPAFLKANEEPDHFILWINKIQANSIPKSAFTGLEQMNSFRKLVAERIKEQDLIT